MADEKVVTLSEEKSKIKCLVADSAAFLKNVDLHHLTEKVFTIADVIQEIKDATTRQRLSVLPYEICFREPSTNSINFVTQFARKTGDFKSLSAVDIRVIALTYQLEKEYGTPEKIKEEPSAKKEVLGKTRIQSDKKIAGFYYEENDKPSKFNDRSMESDNCEDKDNQGISEEEMACIQNDRLENFDNNNVSLDVMEEVHETQEGYVNTDDFEGDDDDGGGWITPGNIKKVKQDMGCVGETSLEETNVKCACLTTDFAMQNVLMQMGLHVLSVQGMIIRQTRNFMQKCFGCNKETRDMEKIFCPSCGNKTLRKISVTVNDDGTIQYHMPRRNRNINIRGTKYSIQTPKGGRHNNQPLMVPDQKGNQNRLPKKKDQLNPLDPDYTSRSNPFAQNDVNSRAFHLNLHVKNKQPRNPNEAHKKKSGRKKR